MRVPVLAEAGAENNALIGCLPPVKNLKKLMPVIQAC